MNTSRNSDGEKPDPYYSLPEPEHLKVPMLVDFSFGETKLEIACTACSVRRLQCVESGRTLDWIHCKAISREKLQESVPQSTMTMLIPFEYVTRARPGQVFDLQVTGPTQDIAFYPANQDTPRDSLPDFEIHRALTTCRGLLVAKPSEGRMYNDFIGKISNEFASEMAKMEAEHGFEFGDEFEVAICRVLRMFLPRRFGICRGYVVNARGDKRGDDIIIFDRMRFPTIRGVAADDYSRKEHVPIEAAYAYIEAKHTLTIEGDDGASLAKAVSQVSLAKLLCVQRREVSLNEIAPYITFDRNIAVEPVQGWPDHRNPIYGAVIARQVRLKSGGPVLTDPALILAEIAKAKLKCAIPPDLVIAGKDNLIIPGLRRDESGAGRTPSPFYLAKQPEEALLYPRSVDGVAFGAGLAFLLWALDWIQLGDIPWPRILEDAILPEEE